MPTLRQIEYMVAIADEGGFGAAAETIGISQPAMSAQIAELEQRLGVVVFDRGRQGARVTPEGAPIVAAARRVLDEARHLVEVAAACGSDLVGSLRLGMIPTMAPYLLPTVVAETRRRYPAAELHLSEHKTAELTEALHAGRVDYGVLAAPVPELDQRFETYELGVEPFVLALPSDCADSVWSTATDVAAATAELPVMLLDDGHCLRVHAAEACSMVGASPTSAIHGTGLSSLVQMVAAGMGTTLLPSSAVAVEARAGSGISIRHLPAPPPHRTVVAAWRRGAARSEQFRALSSALCGPVGRSTAI